ncbi:2-oxo acid dehydrogenase subunit E2 [Acrocarpospora pleiomorpha]|uniref:2-oxo acid dehydrogenase subunit E2 n=1 Tax=Acrocarpospora pleiomorpha TaxID=90975 RepID=UPI0012D31741|nr:2-oxo acid dehydrogenase subunit E2 [Acrocarpospora pleiomorpha]
MPEIRVPKLNNNDTSYIVVEWLVETGQHVKAGDPIAVLETSKAADEITTETDGYVWPSIPLNADCTPGQLLAHLTTTPESPQPATAANPPPSTPPLAAKSSASTADVRMGLSADSSASLSVFASPPVSPSAIESSASHAGIGPSVPSVDASTSLSISAGASTAHGGIASASSSAAPRSAGSPSATQPPLITVPAQALLDELGIPVERVYSLGLSVIRRADVERLAAENVPTATYELPKVQRAVAKAVQLSHATIPAAYTVMAMDLDDTLDLAARLTREVRRPVGLAELFVLAVARLHATFPMFFATLADDRTARLSEAPNIGVTVDTGEGLYVPVIHNAADRTLKEVATRLMEFRLASTTGDFRESDLANGNIAVTLHHDADVSLAIPFIFPGHACALAITAPQPVLTLNDDTLTTKKVANIGLAYDHRLINGREAALFLRALKDTIHEPFPISEQE